LVGGPGRKKEREREREKPEVSIMLLTYSSFIPIQKHQTSFPSFFCSQFSKARRILGIADGNWAYLNGDILLELEVSKLVSGK